MSAQSFALLPDDAPRQVRAVAGLYGFHDPHYRGELATIFDGKGRSLRYLRPRGVSLDTFGEFLYDRGVTGRRLNPVELCDLLTMAFDSTNPPVKVRKAPSRKEVTEETDEDGAIKSTSRMVRASPAVLAVAAKFLKDNAITAAVELNDDLATLKGQLAKKPSKRDLKDAMAAIGNDLLQ